jgi:uncharacterized repeat protein (TIGR03847 family)
MPAEVPKHVLGPLTELRADAEGLPGDRHFFLQARSASGSACLWLERDELQALGLSIGALFTDLLLEGTRKPRPSTEGVDETVEAEPAELDMTVVSLGLGFDDEHNCPILVVDGVEEDAEEQTTLVCWGSRKLFESLQADIERLAHSGRPRCPLCEGVLDDAGHACPRMN